MHSGFFSIGRPLTSADMPLKHCRLLYNKKRKRAISNDNGTARTTKVSGLLLRVRCRLSEAKNCQIRNKDTKAVSSRETGPSLCSLLVKHSPGVLNIRCQDLMRKVDNILTVVILLHPATGYAGLDPPLLSLTGYLSFSRI